MEHAATAIPVRVKLEHIFHAPATPMARAINIGLVLVILLSVFASMMATDTDLAPWQCDMLCYGEYCFAALFLIEYMLRLYAAPNRTAYIFSIYGMVDLLAIIPVFLIGMQGNSLALRIARMLSILRLMKIIRYWGDLMLLVIAMKESIRLLFLVTIAVLLMAVVGGNLMYYIEPENFRTAFDGVWWALVTMSTVGYGDIVPHTLFGKILAGMGMFLGIGIFAVITAIIGSKIHLLTEHRHARCFHCREVVPLSSHYCMHCGQLLGHESLTPSARQQSS